MTGPQILLHVLPGLVALALSAAIVLRLGGRRLKTAMIAVLVCWIAATAGQLLTRQLAAPLIVGDVVFSLWLLWFAWKGPAWWIWTLFAIQAGRLMLHAVAFGAPPGIPYAAIYDTSSLAGLAVLAIAAVVSRRRA